MLAFEAGYQLGYSDSSNGVHIKLEKVVEHFLKSEVGSTISSNIMRSIELEMETNE
uniref:hypothetical protein n=1 Tax=Pseudoalteromonas sp. (strain SANK 73390) TaxID=747457 RepID=UPI00159EEA54|nr:hypothetical protein [Pseudoalteromonas sp. SANK 73390]